MSYDLFKRIHLQVDVNTSCQKYREEVKKDIKSYQELESHLRNVQKSLVYVKNSVEEELNRVDRQAERFQKAINRARKDKPHTMV
jgi:oligoendopeptidase F